MKINWGTSIVLAFVAFISFILFFVVRMSISDKSNHDLVTEDYYRAELNYQQEINAEQSAKDANVRLTVEKKTEGLFIKFPDKIEFKKVIGTVSLYRPSNKHLDFDFPLSLSNSHLLIPDKCLLDGRWDIKVSWEYETEKYLHKESLTY